MREHEYPCRLENSRVAQKPTAITRATSKIRLLGAIALIGSSVAGCKTTPFGDPSPQPGPSSRAPGSSAPPPAAERPAPQSTASAALLEQGRDAREAGQYAEATASLERALRIDPNNPLLWIELAEVKAADGDRAQAREMARKALTLAAGNASIETRARRLL